MADSAKLPAIPETNGDTSEIVGTDYDTTIGVENLTLKRTDSSEVSRADNNNTHHHGCPSETPHALYRHSSRGINSRTATRPSLIKGHSRWNLSSPHLSAPQLVRETCTIDLVTGKEGGKETVCEEVIMAKHAMNPAQRLYSQFFSLSKEKEGDIETGSPKQYRLTSRRTKEKWNLCQKITGIGPDGEGSDAGNVSGGDYLTIYLRWTFRTSFFWLIISSAFSFWALSFIFAALIYAAGRHQPECLSVDGSNFTDAGHLFVDAYALSWTTLSTVGYGIVVPQLPIEDGPRCFGINAFCAVEAYVGVLFAGFMTAVIFGKVARIQSFATVNFSDPIVVRYGTGVMPNEDDDDDLSGHGAAEKRLSNIKQCPCPIMEFRCINHMHSESGGEIVNATVNVVAAVLATKASGSVRSAVTPKARSQKRFGAAQKVSTAAGKAGPLMTGAVQKVTIAAGKAGRLVTDTAQKVTTVAGKAVTTAGQATGIFGETLPENRAYDPDEPFQALHHTNERNLSATDMYTASMTGFTREHQIVLDEGSDLVPQRVFSNLEVETPAHPFFKRVWFIRHVLDQTSPLLSQKAKELIAQNDGFWPEELNNYQAVRENLHFHEIIVNLSGTGNATGSSVYAQKVYSFSDVNIGYSFVSTMFRRPDGKVSVDLHLINDVVEQNGGGGEPFTVVKDRRFSNVGHVAVGAYEKTHDKVAQAQDMVTTAAEMAHGKVMDAMLNTAEKVTETGAQFTQISKLDDTNPVAALDGAEPLTKKYA